MVEQSQPKKDSSQSLGEKFRIKPPSKTIGNVYIQEIALEFQDNSDPTAQALCVKFDDGDKIVGASYSNGFLRIFNAYTGKQTHMIVNNHNHFHEDQRQTINCFRFRPVPHGSGVGVAKDILVGVTTDGRVQYWHYTLNKCAMQIIPKEAMEVQQQEQQDETEEQLAYKKRRGSKNQVDRTLNCLDFNCTLDRLAVAGNEAKINIYDEHSNSKDFLMTLKPNGQQHPGHSKRIFALNFDKQNSNILYSGGWDDAVNINDLREGGPVGVVIGPHVCGESIDVFDNLMIAGSYRNQKNLLLFDLRYPTKVLQYLEMDSSATSLTGYFSDCQVYSAQFYKQMTMSNNQILAAGSTGGKNELRFFEAIPNEEEKEGQFNAKFKNTWSISEFGGGIQSLDFSNKTNRVVVGLSNGQVTAFKLKINP